MEWTRVYVQIIAAVVLRASSEHVVLEYHFINRLMSWGDAQSYCRLKHSDLATVRDAADHWDMIHLLGPTAPHSSWIGLRRTTARRWRWSDGTGTLRSDFWREGEPNNLDKNEWCVMQGSDGEWNDIVCNDVKGFVCYEVNANMVRYVRYNSMTSWKGAQNTCRKNHVDLVAVTSSEIQSAIQSLVAEGKGVWIGLFSDAWEWSDGNDISYRSWSDGDSDGGNGDCAAISMTEGGFWAAKDCAAKMPFVCQGGLKTRKTLVKIQMNTAANLNSEFIIQHLHNQLKTNHVSDFKLSWRRGKDNTIFRRKLATPPDKKRVCDDV